MFPSGRLPGRMVFWRRSYETVIEETVMDISEDELLELDLFDQVGIPDTPIEERAFFLAFCSRRPCFVWIIS